MSRIVLALGGNALGKTPSEQKHNVIKAAKAIAKLAKHNQVLICHGNGPQIGIIKNSFDCAFKNGVVTEEMPLVECGAMSQGYIGYYLQTAIDFELRKLGVKKEALTIVSQTLINEKDPAFDLPSKPIGLFYTKAEAKKLAAINGKRYIDDAGRGWRQVVASPQPIGFVEINAMNDLLDKDYILVAGGGGGVPVYRNEEGELIKRTAVVDKDSVSAKQAELTNADKLVILTAVDFVKVNYGKPNETSLKNISLAELDKYIAEGQFAPGSMLPKVEGCRTFVKRTGQKAYIGSLENAELIIEGKSGTTIYK